MHVNFIVKLRSIAEKRADDPTWPLCAKDRIRESFRGANPCERRIPSIFMRLNPYESKDQNIRSKLASTFIVWNQSKSKLVDLDCEVDRNKSYIVVARCATLATNRFGHRVEFDQAVMESQ